ncbi:MAG: dephospho-CoA kinase [Christensenellales bacterium]|jgi:dephospho-CoA kinase
MRVIGLTGGIASGKSAVSEILRALGGVIIDADCVSRAVVRPNEAGARAVCEAFGGAYFTNGELDRKKLAALVFNDAIQLKKLNRTLHPIIREAIRKEVCSIKSGESLPPFVVIDAALLIESGIAQDVDEVWVVHTPKDIRLCRVMRRDGLSEEEARARINAQMKDEERLAQADVIIDNTQDLEHLKAQVLKRLSCE